MDPLEVKSVEQLEGDNRSQSKAYFKHIQFSHDHQVQLVKILKWEVRNLVITTTNILHDCCELEWSFEHVEVSQILNLHSLINMEVGALQNDEETTISLSFVHTLFQNQTMVGFNIDECFLNWLPIGSCLCMFFHLWHLHDKVHENDHCVFINILQFGKSLSIGAHSL